MAGKTRALSIVRGKKELVEEIQQNLPQFLVMHCLSCDRDTRVDGLEITKDIDRSGEVPALVLKGSCKKCGKEIVERFGTTEERFRIAKRTEQYWEREERRRAKKNKERESSREKLTVAKTATKAKKAKAEKTPKAEKVKKTAAKAEKKTTKASKKESSNGSTRQAVYVRGEGKPTQQQAFIIVAGGALRTVEEINDRWGKAAKKGLVGDRTRDVQTVDLTFMCSERAGQVEIDGKEYEMWMGKDPESGAVLYGSTYKDVLGNGGPMKVKNGKVGKVSVAKSKKDLKD